MWKGTQGASVGKALPKKRSAYDGFHLELDDEGRLLSWRRSEDFRRGDLQATASVLVSSAEMSAEERRSQDHRRPASFARSPRVGPVGSRPHKGAHGETVRRIPRAHPLGAPSDDVRLKSKLHWTDAFARLDVVALQRESDRVAALHAVS